jgi:hypothetical protein
MQSYLLGYDATRKFLSAMYFILIKQKTTHAAKNKQLEQ